MATLTHPHSDENRDVASVDYLVDETGAPVDVPDGSRLTVSDDVERSVGATSPTSWWQTGLIALGIVAAILLALQLFNGVPSTDVQPGTPVAAPQEPAPPTI